MTSFADACKALERRATGPATMSAAADAMGEALLDVAARALGGDVTMSGTGRAVTVEPQSTDGVATVRAGGAYGLADAGRHRERRATRRGRRGGLATPWGPRASVAGSTWAGLRIGDRAGRDVYDAGRQAIRDAVGT